MKTLFTVLFAVIALSAHSQQPAYVNVGNEKFAALMKQPNTLVLDVRTPEEYRQGHIEGARLIDYHSKNFAQQIESLDKNKTYLVYCMKGGRSSNAAQLMADKGFTNVYNLENGFSEWKGADKK
jgi:rhodanese-related sulfurtransferase